MTTIAEQLQEAADKATQASEQGNLWATGPINTTVPTDSGPVPTIAEFTRAAQARADAAIEALGWVLAGDFTAGCTVTERNQYVLVVGGPGYRWDGALPKVVAPGSSPTPIEPGAWVLVGDATLRGDLAAPGGAGLVGGVAKPVTWSGFAGGVDLTGAVSCKNAVVAALQSGGEIRFPAGNYFIPASGGPIVATITKSLLVTCEPGVRFFTDSLDGNMIAIQVPSNGAGLPVDGITCDWDGGFFDQRNQKNSTTVPFAANYPPANLGTSNICDALYMVGFYTASGVTKAGMKRATARRVVTYAGDHWQTAGGDSGVFIGGAEEQLIELCYFKGNRDLGAYPSAHESGQIKCSVTVRNNIFDTCFHGAAAKRGFESIDITKNTFINCVRAAQSEFISVRNRNVGIYNNTFIGCGITARVQQSDGGFIYGNVDKEHGATLANGSIEPIVGLRGYLIESCSDIVTGPNFASAEKAAAAAAYPTQGQGVTVTGASTGCVQVFNIFKGWRRLGNDETSGGKNVWSENRCPDGTSKNVVFTDIANGSERRVADQLGNAPWWRTPQYIFLTDETNPLIRGYNGTSASAAGIYFKGADIGLAGPNVLVQGNLFPVTPNTTAIGAATSPVAGGWTQSAFTVTSDEKTKTRPFEITDAMLDAVAEIDWVMFQIIGRILEKGEDAARWHVGVMAQRVKEVFEKHGVDPHDHAFFCYDKWDAKPAVTLEVPAAYDMHGLMVSEARTEIIEEAVEAGDLYSIRYDELLALKIKQVERDHVRKIDSLEARLATLEAK